MKRLGGSGQTFLSFDEAYRALSAPRDSIDDGLIMYVPLLYVLNASTQLTPTSGSMRWL